MGESVTLLIEAGGTKSSWALVGRGGVQRLRTPGINASVMPVDRMLAVVLEGAEQLEIPLDEVGGVRFYGAGLVGNESILKTAKVLQNVFPSAVVSCGSDLLAAANAAFGREEGVVAILGTGSNSGLYDGRTIVQNVRPGGYILGDEGSGSALGKAFLGDWVKGLLPEGVKKRFEEEYHPTYGEIVENVYRGDNPAAYLASFAPFILSCAGCDYVDGLVERNLRNFVERSLLQYDIRRFPVAVVGSFGLACRGALERVAKDYGLTLGRFVAEPMDELVRKLKDDECQ